MADSGLGGWRAVGGSPPLGVATASLVDLLDAVRAEAGHVVPFVGAGLACAAGAPSFGQLVADLRDADDHSSDPGGSGGDFFAVVDELAQRRGEAWVQQQTARIIDRAPVVATATLTAVAKTASRLVITTNYDLSVEASAEAAGIDVVPVTLGTFRHALWIPDAAGPPGPLVVLHLHGIASDPATIVLTNDSYQRIRTDEAAQLVLRARGISGRFVFLGHSLDQREVHIRRDVAWATSAGVFTDVPVDASDSAPRRAPGALDGAPGHLMVCCAPDVAAPDTVRMATDLADRVRLRVFVVNDPASTFEAVKKVASLIAGPSALATAHLAPTVAGEDAHYVPHAVAAVEEVADEAAVGAYLARAWREGTSVSTDLDVRCARLLLVAAGGYGKTRELREIARRADHAGRPALHLRLGALAPPTPGVTPEVTFVRWMGEATSPQGTRVPRLTAAALAEQSYVLLLDGLDEVSADRRTQVIDLLNTVVAAHPQHRWVVATRPVPEASALLGFTAWTFAPDTAWAGRYAYQRGVNEQHLSAFLRDAPAVRDLMGIPIFAAAAVDRLAEGRPPARTALGLVTDLADAPLGSDQRLPADPPAVTAWLDRLALLLMLRGQPQASVAELMDTGPYAGLHTGLDMEPTPEMIAELAVRALVTDTSQVVQFPAHIVQEARAARALLCAGQAGRAAVRDHVLVDLGVLDAGGHPVVGVRPSWVGTLELLLGAADATWRAEVATVDPTLAARATPTTASVNERRAAARTLWEVYRRRRVWLARGHGPDERDDAGALIRLLRSLHHAVDGAPAAGLPDGFIDELYQGLGDPEPTVRANALLALTAVHTADVAENTSTALTPLVADALADPHPVVRRQAATIAGDHQLAILAQDCAARAIIDPDEMAAQTLLDVAVDLAGDHDLAITFAAAVPPSLAAHAWTAVAQRVPRTRLLDLVTGPPVRLDLLDVLLKHGWTRSPDWRPPEVAQLAAALTALGPAHWYHKGAPRVLATHPLAALLGVLQAPRAAPGDLTEEGRQETLLRLTSGWSAEQVDQAVALLTDGPRALARAAGIEPDGSHAVDATGPPSLVDAYAVEWGLAHLRQRSALLVHSARQTAPTTPLPPVPAPASRAGAALGDLLQADRFADLVLHAPATVLGDPGNGLTEDLLTGSSSSSGESQGGLDGDRRACLAAWVHQQIVDRVGAGALASATVTAEAPVPVADVRLAQWSAYLDLDLPAFCWLPIALVALHWPDQALYQWVRQRCTSEHVSQLLAALHIPPSQPPDQTDSPTRIDQARRARQVLAARAVIPAPWSSHVTELLLRAAFETAAVCGANPATGGASPVEQAAAGRDLAEVQATVTAAVQNGKEYARALLPRLTPRSTPRWVLPALVQAGDAEAEVVLLTDLADHPEQAARWPLHGDIAWLEHVRHRTSADVVD